MKTLEQLSGLTDQEKDVIRALVDAAKANIETFGELVSVAHLLDDHGHMHIIGAKFGDEQDKNSFELVVKEHAIQLNAVLCVFLSESWMLKDADAIEYTNNRDKYPNGITDHPNKTEAVSFYIENSTGSFTGYATLRPDEGGKIMAEPQFYENVEQMGRFTSFLPKNIKEGLH